MNEQPNNGETTMVVVKQIGIVSLVSDGTKFFLKREGDISQPFENASDAWVAMRNRKIRWHRQ